MTGDIRRSPQRQQLREAACAYVERMRALGRMPNRRVEFEGCGLPAWVLDDPIPHGLERRWLLLADGDTWCEIVYGPESAAAGLDNTYGWMTGPSEALHLALAESERDARAGGAGFLLAERAAVPYPVRDRRAVPRGQAQGPGL